MSRVEDKPQLQIEWEKINTAGVLPKKCKGHTMISFKSRIILFGGYHGNKHSDEVWVFANKWKKIDINNTVASPCKRTGHTACVRGNKMIVFGGSGMNDILNDLWEFDLLKYKWQKIVPDSKSEQTPSPRYGHSAVLVKDKLYVVGGYGFGYLSDFWEFNFANKQWKRLDVACEGQKPSKRCFHSCSAIMNSKILLFGGQNGTYLNDLWLYDIQLNRWNRIKLLTHALFHRQQPISSSLSTTTTNSSSTSSSSSSNHSSTLISTQSLIQQQQQSAVQNIEPTPRSKHAACSFFSNAMIIHGGTTGNFRENDLWVFILISNDSGYWLKVNQVMYHSSSSASSNGNSHAALAVPVPRDLHTVCIQDFKNLYLFAGSGKGTYFNDFWKVNMDAVISTLAHLLIVQKDIKLLDESSDSLNAPEEDQETEDSLEDEELKHQLQHYYAQQQRKLALAAANVGIGNGNNSAAEEDDHGIENHNDISEYTMLNKEQMKQLDKFDYHEGLDQFDKAIFGDEILKLIEHDDNPERVIQKLKEMLKNQSPNTLAEKAATILKLAPVDKPKHLQEQDEQEARELLAKYQTHQEEEEEEEEAQEAYEESEEQESGESNEEHVEQVQEQQQQQPQPAKEQPTEPAAKQEEQPTSTTEPRAAPEQNKQLISEELLNELLDKKLNEKLSILKQEQEKEVSTMQKFYESKIGELETVIKFQSSALQALEQILNKEIKSRIAHDTRTQTYYNALSQQVSTLTEMQAKQYHFTIHQYSTVMDYMHTIFNNATGSSNK